MYLINKIYVFMYVKNITLAGYCIINTLINNVYKIRLVFVVFKQNKYLFVNK